MVPFFYLWLIKIGYNFIVTKYFLVFLPFIIVHIINGVDYYTYIISVFYLLAIYIQVTTFYAATNKLKDEHFIKIIQINFILSLVGVFLLYTPYYEIMWTQGVMSTGEATRFRMFTYEPSYYSTLLVPFLFYSYFTYINNRCRKNLWLLCMVAFPLIISFSLGFIATTVIVLLITFIIDLKYVLKKKQLVLLGILASLAMGYVFFTENPLTDRINKVIADEDASASGRVVHSTVISFEVASL
ncbi:membrane protein, partial [Candidatus Thiomargarita nelsonii]